MKCEEASRFSKPMWNLRALPLTCSPLESPPFLTVPLKSGQKRSSLCGEGMVRIQILREFGLGVPPAAL